MCKWKKKRRGPIEQAKGEASQDQQVPSGASRGSLDGESAASSGSTRSSSTYSLGEGAGEGGMHCTDSFIRPIPETVNRQWQYISSSQSYIN